MLRLALNRWLSSSLGQVGDPDKILEVKHIDKAIDVDEPPTGQTLYILDEPTTGLHFHDIRQLLDVLHRLTDTGNTVTVIEHNLEVIKTADWIINLGPEGGDKGGRSLRWGGLRRWRRTLPSIRVATEPASTLCWVGLIDPGRRRLWLQ